MIFGTLLQNENTYGFCTGYGFEIPAREMKISMGCRGVIWLRGESTVCILKARYGTFNVWELNLSLYGILRYFSRVICIL